MRTLNFGLNNNLGRAGRGSISVATRLPVTDFFNGFESAGSTYSCGPTVVADYQGTLVTSPADVLPIEGMRLATTVAEGATLGPELVTNGDFSDGTTGWTSTGDASWSSEEGAAKFTGGSETWFKNTVTTYPAGKTFLVQYDLLSVGAGIGVRVNIGGSTYAQTSFKKTVGTYNYLIVADGGTQTIVNIKTTGGTWKVDNISVREVIPTWLPTDSSGDPIHASTPLRTTKGTVKKYDETYKGPLIEPARTNYFLNSTVPVTQNITTTAQQYTVTVKGTGSVTLSGTATGVATDGSPLTVTATAGTLTCTVAGTLSRVNVEAGAFGTSFITTGATTVTRPSANLTRPTAGTALESGNNFAIYGRVVPKGVTNLTYLFHTGLGFDPLFGLYTNTDTLRFRKRDSANGDNVINSGITTPSAVPVEYLIYQHSVYGAGVSVKVDGGTWSAWATLTGVAGTANATKQATYQIGARNNADHFAGNYPFTEIIRLNSNLHPQTQLADLLAKGRI